ncbi:hypothetical protein BCR33DRAFT_762924 [Rhizoclosmatium globosum]|uniref:Protein OS-9 homolog n=1 Tax=Rhizoclosmatium globosum TaxID=329046 RepID=A0A1Y2CSD3_9FUNG|nr:hypothetical protein BCR33DRAFT_762924 [Rhizoclosmatium globosum]|eukprot:ORY49806.1 hypothetical protein BCR33DRAFT_762924 [Rhizoclosmatium globosum]
MQVLSVLALLATLASATAPIDPPKRLSRAAVYSDLFASERFHVAIGSNSKQAAESTTAQSVKVSVGQRSFSCSLPGANAPEKEAAVQDEAAAAAVKSPDDDDEEDVDPVKAAVELRRRNVWKGMELMKGVETNCLYWFHPRTEEEEKRWPEKRQDYFLGKRTATAHSTAVDYVTDDKDQGHLSMQYTDGTKCDLTGVGRAAEVQIHCVPGSIDMIQNVRETSTCVYIVHIITSRLCNDAAFVPKTLDAGHPDALGQRILCEPINSLSSSESDLALQQDSDEGYAKNEPLDIITLMESKGAYSLDSLYPDLVARAVKTEPIIIAPVVGGAAQNMLANEKIAKKVEEAIQQLWNGKSKDKRAVNEEEPKVIEFVIDANGNVVLQNDDEEALVKQLFAQQQQPAGNTIKELPTHKVKKREDIMNENELAAAAPVVAEGETVVSSSSSSSSSSHQALHRHRLQVQLIVMAQFLKRGRRISLRRTKSSKMV